MSGLSLTSGKRGTKLNASPLITRTIGYGSDIFCASSARAATTANKRTMISAWYMIRCQSDPAVNEWTDGISLLHQSNTPLLRYRCFFCPRAVRLKLSEMFFRPTTKSLERFDQCASQLCKRIFYFRRHNRMHCALHQSVAFEAAERL